MIRSNLEYGVNVWNPHLKKSINKMESVQRRATKMVKKIFKLDYTGRLKFLKLTSLEDRRIRGGLIQVFKIVRSFEEVQLVRGLNFALNRQRSRGNSFQLKRDLVKNCTPRYHFLLNRLVGSWNKLPEEVVNSLSVNQFKQRYDNFLLKNKKSSCKYPSG